MEMKGTRSGGVNDGEYSLSEGADMLSVSRVALQAAVSMQGTRWERLGVIDGPGGLGRWKV